MPKTFLSSKNTWELECYAFSQLLYNIPFTDINQLKCGYKSYRKAYSIMKVKDGVKVYRGLDDLNSKLKNYKISNEVVLVNTIGNMNVYNEFIAKGYRLVKGIDHKGKGLYNILNNVFQTNYTSLEIELRLASILDMMDNKKYNDIINKISLLKLHIIDKSKKIIVEDIRHRRKVGTIDWLMVMLISINFGVPIKVYMHNEHSDALVDSYIFKDEI